MKISEVRAVIQNHSPEQLRVIITQLYKAMPKAVKEEQDIDGILRDPGILAKAKPGRQPAARPDLGLLSDEADEFMEDAYAQNYCAPNRFISKGDRPKWRFTVKRLYKDILLAADETNVSEAAQLLEKLYHLLCYSCENMLFNAYDPFQSVGIEQAEFFRRVLALKYQSEDKNTFINDALVSMLNEPLNRYTLYETRMRVILEFLKTADLKEMMVVKCDELIETIKREPTPKREDYSALYKREGKLNNLATMGFLCYARLSEYEKAISYFKANNCEDDPEIALYVLLWLLFSLNQKDYFLREYEKAVKNAITPREALRKMYNSTKEKGELPAYFG